MDVYLLRTSLTDDGSHLSAEGRRIVRALGNKLRLDDEPSFDRFVVSPDVPAAQTAELFADRTDYVGVVEVLPTLIASTPPEVVVPILLRAGSSIVVVADEPVLATLGAFLVGRPTFPPAVHAQVSLIKDRRPEWALRPGESARSLLLIA
jgi:phosphohistidine phosphatase SixA